MCIALLLLLQGQLAGLGSGLAMVREMRRLIVSAAAYAALYAARDAVYVSGSVNDYELYYLVNFLYNLSGFVMAVCFYACFAHTFSGWQKAAGKLIVFAGVLFAAVSAACWCLRNTDLFVDLQPASASHFLCDMVFFGPLDYLWYIPVYLPAMYIFINSLVALRDKKRYPEREVHSRILLFLAVMFGAVVCQAVFRDLRIMPVFISLGMVYCYFFVVRTLISRDELTDLDNRRQLLKDLDSKLAAGRHVGLIALDMDNFKKINDRFGHSEGDAALQKFAQVLKFACRGRDARPYRCGGDEFVVVKVSWTGDTRRETEELKSDIARRLQFLDKKQKGYAVTASMGIACSEDAENIKDLLEIADAEMYAEKKKYNKGR